MAGEVSDTKWAKADGLAIAYRTEGAGDKAVVFQHGLFANKARTGMPAIRAAALGAGFKVIEVDSLGHGESDKPHDPELYKRKPRAGHICAVLDAEGIERAHYVGYSMGGPVVAHYSRKYPESVKSMTLIAPAGFMIEDPTANMWTIKPLIGEWFWNLFGSLVVFQDNKLDGSPARKDPLALSKSDFMEKARSQMQFKGFIESLLSTVRHFNLFNAEEVFLEVGQLNIPTLTIWGTEDGVVPFAGSEGLMKSIPHSQLIIIERGKHDITYAEPTKVGSAIRDFLNQQLKTEA